MFEKFGELESVEELNKAAAGLKEEGDIASLIVLSEENGLDKEDAEDYAAGEMEELATSCTAAHGRLKVESEDLKIAGVLMDWVDEIRQECLENEKVCAGVMNHSLAGYMAILLEKGFEEKAVVDNRIVQQAKEVAKVAGDNGISIGFPNLAERKETIRAYYGGKK